MALLAGELAEKNRELETIVYVISHDLRSPLLNVQGFGAALLRSCEELREHIDISKPEVAKLLGIEIPRALHFIKVGSAKMDSLLTGFLRFSRSGSGSLNIEPLAVDRIVTSSLQSLKYQADTAGAAISVGEVPSCLGDETMMGQVFSNLLDNALEYRHLGRQCVISISGHSEMDTHYTL